MRLLNVHFFPVKIYLLFTWFFDIICCNVKNKLHDGSIGACVYSNQVTLFLIISSFVRTAVIAILNERSWTGWFRRSFVNIYTVLWFFFTWLNIPNDLRFSHTNDFSDFSDFGFGRSILKILCRAYVRPDLYRIGHLDRRVKNIYFKARTQRYSQIMQNYYH